MYLFRRAINTTRAMNCKTTTTSSSGSGGTGSHSALLHKRSTVTAFLQPKSSSQTLHSHSLKREDLDSATDEDLVDLLQGCDFFEVFFSFSFNKKFIFLKNYPYDF